MQKRPCNVCKSKGTIQETSETYLVCWKCLGDGMVIDNPSNTYQTKQIAQTQDGDSLTRKYIQDVVNDDMRTDGNQ